ncbi:MAG: polyprenyl synthetase family protein [bacterium]|nr:polyprenyl synthetase family protein [bacterium]
MEFEAYLSEKQRLIESALERYLPGEGEYPPLIHEAMRYSVLGGGKRLRAILVLAAAEAVGGESKMVLPAACAIELIHAYSLIHDDLPALDNDAYRRGKPSSHKKFGEAIAILAGDALLTMAFRLVAKNANQPGIRPESVLQVIKEIGAAAGTFGMIGGQVVDLECAGRDIDPPTLQYIHTHKTGRLICASLRSGAILSGSSKEELITLTKYGEHVGLAFQIVDDILNLDGNEEKMGKTKGSDLAAKKLTYPAVYGLSESRERAGELIEEAVSFLKGFDARAEPLREIAWFIGKRDY